MTFAGLAVAVVAGFAEVERLVVWNDRFRRRFVTED